MNVRNIETMKLLKTLLLAAFIIGTSGISFAQSVGQQVKGGNNKEYKATIDGWEVSLDKAYALSKKTGKPILANFTGSDWCGWCMRLKRDVFVTQQFKEWAKANVILLELDFPRRSQVPAEIKQQNAGLAQAFGVRGYPTLWVFTISKDPKTGKSAIQGLAKTGYVAGGPGAWIKDLETKLAQAGAIKQ